MTTKKFVWGKVIESGEINLDAQIISFTKYHPHKYENHMPVLEKGRHAIDENKIFYHCEELSESFNSIEALVIAWIANKTLGHNQHMLVAGVCRALNVKYDE
jgi:hypothetical protein